MRKFHQEVVLLEQAFVMDGKTKVSKVVDEAAKQVGAPVRIAGFLRFAAGRGHREEVGGLRGRGGRAAQEVV